MALADDTTRIAALTDILVYLAQADDLSAEKITKADLPSETKAALEEWAASVNEQTGEETASFSNSIDHNVTRCSYYDNDRDFYLVQYCSMAISPWTR